MKIRTSVLCLLVTCCCCFVTASRFDPSTVKPIGKPPSRYLNATEMIEFYGYKSSGYTVETEDGYSLHLLRMGSNKGPPVLMVNGFGALPEGLLVYGPYHSLPYVLHDLGYDIWFPAKRGIYSKHKTLKFTDPKFWDFSHDEIGMYDMPPQIDQVMQVTGRNKLLYLGVSQGSAIFMSLCSLRPSYCDLFVGSVQIVPAMNIPSLSELSPAARLSWFSSRSIYVANRLLGIPYLAVDGKTIWETNICVRMETLCLGLLNLANGVVKKQVYEGWLQYLVAILSNGGASTKQFGHFMQMSDKGGAFMFDYGPEKNMVKYGQPTPPRHNLSAIKSPTLIIYALDDYFIPVSTVKRIAKEIGDNAILYPAKDPTYGHIAIVNGVDVYKQYYAKVVDFFDSLTGMH